MPYKYHLWNMYSTIQYRFYVTIYMPWIQFHGASVGQCPVSILGLSFSWIPMLKIRLTKDRIIFNIGIHMPVRHHHIDTDPKSLLRRAMRPTLQTIHDFKIEMMKMVSALIVIPMIKSDCDWSCVFTTAPLSCANCDPGITVFFILILWYNWWLKDSDHELSHCLWNVTLFKEVCKLTSMVRSSQPRFITLFSLGIRGHGYIDFILNRHWILWYIRNSKNKTHYGKLPSINSF